MLLKSLGIPSDSLWRPRCFTTKHLSLETARQMRKETVEKTLRAFPSATRKFHENA